MNVPRIYDLIKQKQDLETSLNQLEDEIGQLRSDFIQNAAQQSQLSDAECTRIAESGKSSYRLPFADYAKVVLAIRDYDRRLAEDGLSSFFPLVSPSDIPSEYQPFLE